MRDRSAEPGLSKQQDTWLETALQGLDKELGGAIGPLSDQDIVTAKAMVIATLRKSIAADPAGFRKSLEANAQAAAVMMGTAEPAEPAAPASGAETGATSATTSGTASGAASPIRSLRQSLASGKTPRKTASKGEAKEPAVPDF